MNRLTFTILIILTVSRAATVSGYIKDNKTNKSIPNANIIIRETGQGTASNPYGYFSINLPGGTYTLETSVIGFKTDSREVIVDENNIELNIKLQTVILEFSEIQVQGLFTTRLGHESIDIISSGTRKEELLIPDGILKKSYTRRKNIDSDSATEELIKLLKHTASNEEFFNFNPL